MKCRSKCSQFFRMFNPFSTYTETKKNDPNKFSARLNAAPLAIKQQVLNGLLNVFGCSFHLVDPNFLMFKGQEFTARLEKVGMRMTEAAIYDDPVYSLLDTHLGEFINWFDGPRQNTREPFINCNNKLIEIADHFELLSNTLASCERISDPFSLERFRQEKIYQDKIRAIIQNFIGKDVKNDVVQDLKDAAPSAPALRASKPEIRKTL